MSGKSKLAIAAIAVLAVALPLLAGTWDCQYDGNKKGTVGKPNNLTIDLGTVLWAGDDSGKKTTVRWPSKFDHYNGTVLAGTWNKDQIMTPSGNFVLKLNVSLAGRKSYGVWWSKRNVVTVEVHDTDMSGAILATKTLDKSVSSPSESTIELPQVTAGLSSGNSKSYAIKLQFDKYDGDGGNDGWCSLMIRVGAT